ncbi:zinc ribbon domain-containing protein [Actinoplanes subglobosus]|uniref:Cas12f1-like TNB domain-containing protein n=1 Tax=Actinoplanes subglobosus TaxID=1547892 RepID=A0ABV8IQB0_9ACTN
MFVVSFRVSFSPSQRRKVRARFNTGTALYNAALREAFDRAARMRADARWLRARELGKDETRRAKLFNAARDEAGFTKTGLMSFGSRLRVGWLRDGVAAQEAQHLAATAFGAVAEWVYGVRGRPRFKPMRRGIRSMSSKDTLGALRLAACGRRLQWGAGFTAALVVDPDNPVHTHGLAAIDAGKVLSVRLVRRTVNGREYYDAQLVCDGKPLQRYETRDGVVGLDLGPSMVAVVSDDGVFLERFCDQLDANQAQVRRLQRKLDRQHRAGSPRCFDRQSRHGKGRCEWSRSGQATITAARLAEEHRRQAAHRKNLHGNLVNRVLAQSATLRVENLSKVAWQKNFGRSVAFRAPGMFETLLIRKAENADGTATKINAYRARLSQTCVCGAIRKKPLSLRVHHCPCGMVEQRDIWSAFLARHSTGQAPDLAAARTELRDRHDIGGAPRSWSANLRVPAAVPRQLLVPAAAGRAGGAERATTGVIPAPRQRGGSGGVRGGSRSLAL